MAEVKETLKELLAKKNPSDADVAKVVELLKSNYKSRLWPVVDDVLESYLQGGSDVDALDELEEAVGLEGESFVKPRVRPTKLLKTQNSLACGNPITPDKIGMFIEEKREVDDEGEYKCEAIELGREVKVIPILRVNYITVSVERDGNAKVYRIYPPAENIDNPFAFLRKMQKKVEDILDNSPELDSFTVKKTSRLYYLAKPEGEKQPSLFSIDLSPVDSFQISNFEKMLRQRTGRSGYPQLFKIGKSAIMKATQVKLPNGNIVIATELALSDQEIKNKDDWRVIIIPIAYAIKNYIGKLNHEFNYGMIDIEETGEGKNVSTESPREESPLPAAEEESQVFDEDFGDEIDF